MNVLLRVLPVQIEELSDDEVRYVVLNRGTQEDDTLLKEEGVDVKGPLPSGALLDDHRYDVLRLWLPHKRSPPHSKGRVLLAVLTLFSGCWGARGGRLAACRACRFHLTGGYRRHPDHDPSTEKRPGYSASAGVAGQQALELLAAARGLHHPLDLLGGLLGRDLDPLYLRQLVYYQGPADPLQGQRLQLLSEILFRSAQAPQVSLQILIAYPLPQEPVHLSFQQDGRELHGGLGEQGLHGLLPIGCFGLLLGLGLQVLNGALPQGCQGREALPDLSREP